LSGYLPLHGTLVAERHSANHDTPIFMAHGRGDPVIAIARAEQSRDILQAGGHQVEWHEYMMQHAVCPEEIEDIGNWLRKTLTPSA
jgi:phospholipase/carboxylesterase